MIKVNLKEVLKETFPNGETRLDLRFILEDPTVEKDPKTDDKNLKKSLTGKVAVVKGEDGVLKYVDHLTAAEEKDYPGNLLRTIFKNGEIENEITFAEMKKNLHG